MNKILYQGKIYPAVALLLGLLFLAGCGGGGSSSGGNGSGGGGTQTAHYTYTDLGLVDGGVKPTAINNNGQIVGELGNYRGTLEQPFRHSGSGPVTHSDNLGFYRSLGGSLYGSDALAVNNAGLVVGLADDPYSQSGTQVVSFAYDTTYHNLGDLPDTFSKITTATGVNDAGVIVGYTMFEHSLETHPFRHTGTGPITAADDLGLFGGYKVIQPAAISNAGIIVGTVDESSLGSFISVNHAFLYDTSFHDLSQAGMTSGATAVNATGQVVGYFISSGNSQHAFRHMGLGTIGAGDDLGVISRFDSSYATAINASGVVVGNLLGSSVNHAFVYSGNGPMQDLTNSSLVTNLPSGQVLQVATGINDRGQIVGYTNENAGAHGWLLTPVP